MAWPLAPVNPKALTVNDNELDCIYIERLVSG